MDRKTKKMISNLAEDIIRIYDLNSPIQDMEDVVTKLGGHVEYKNIPVMIKGTLKKSGDSFVIYISLYRSAEQKRFRIAQELGHLFLHMGYKTNPNMWEKREDEVFYQSQDALEERIATAFAYSLLMPQADYKRILDKNTIGNKINITEVAKYFTVSVSAAVCQGKLYGYIESNNIC